MSAELIERMKALRPASRNPTSLRAYLTVYMRTWRLCYTDYMQGAKALAQFLGPIELPKDPRIHSSTKLPSLLSSYEIQQLSALLSGGYSLSNKELWHRAIVFTLVDIVTEDFN